MNIKKRNMEKLKDILKGLGIIISIIFMTKEFFYQMYIDGGTFGKYYFSFVLLPVLIYGCGMGVKYIIRKNLPQSK